MVYVYSKNREGSFKLSNDFKVREFACKDGSDTVFIDPELVTILQQIRYHFGKPVIINSGYRTDAYNNRIGGAKYSQHKYGKAADIRIAGVSPDEIAEYANTLMPDYGGIGIYKNFVHVDTRLVKSRWEN